MSNPKECDILRKATPQLESAIRETITPLCAKLLARGLIDRDQRIKLRNAARDKVERAADLVDIIAGKVEQDPKNFYTFIEVLQESGDTYAEVLQRMKPGPHGQGDTDEEEEPIHTLNDHKCMVLQPRPKEGTAELQAVEIFARKVTIILHTVNNNETQAVLQEMEPLSLKPGVKGEGVKVEGVYNLDIVPNSIIVGMFGGYKSALVQTEQGEKCKPEIEAALKKLKNTKAVIAVGVAWSNPKYKFGDVLVSKTIRKITNPKFNPGEIIARSSEFDSVPVSDDLSKTFTRNPISWNDFKCTKSDSGRTSSVYAGDIVSVPWLLADHKVRDAILETFPDAIGGEMEGYELVKIQKDCRERYRQLSVIIIKGAADYGDENKQAGKKWQFTAAKAAASYAKHKLELTSGGLFD